jgi:hypothetical protein
MNEIGKLDNFNLCSLLMNLVFQEYPPSMLTHLQTLRALVGAIEESSGKGRAARFVVDLIGSQLNMQDITQIWDMKDPMAILAKVLDNDGRGEPESRLLWAAGKDTMMACYHIGIYSDKQLVGQGNIMSSIAATSSLLFLPFLSESGLFFVPRRHCCTFYCPTAAIFQPP